MFGAASISRTAKQLAKARLPGLPTSRDKVRRYADRHQWAVIKIKAIGGEHNEYLLSNLTAEQLAALAQHEAVKGLPVATETKRVSRSDSGAGAPCATHVVEVAAGETIAVHGSREYELIRAELWRKAETKKQTVRDEATKDAAAVLKAFELIRSGCPKMEAYAEAAREREVAVSTLRDWIRAVKSIERTDWAAALIDERGNRSEAAAYSYPQSFFNYYSSDYLRMDRPPRIACYRRAIAAARAEGISGDDLPAEITLWRRLRKEVPWQSIKFARHGSEVLHRAYPAQTRDRSILHAMECVNGDGYRWNNSVIWPDGEICRVLMWYFQCSYSSFIPIESIQFGKTEHAGLVRLSIGGLISAYCIPELFVIDNTMAAASKWITGRSPSRHRWTTKEADVFGLITQLGARHIATLPRVGGSSKPGERAGGDWDRDIARSPALAGSWLGHNTAARPDATRKPVPFEKFKEIVLAGIAENNERPGRRSPVCRGRSFGEVFRESFATIPVKRPTPEQLRLCLLAAQKVRCAKIDGHIELFGNRYWGESVAALAGREVVVRFDPEKLQHNVFVYNLDGQIVGEAQCHAPVGFIDASAAKEHNRLRRQSGKHYKALAKNAQRMSAIELTAKLPTPPAPQVFIRSNVRELFRPGLEQPSGATPASQTPAQSKEDLGAERRAYRKELEKIGSTAWDEDQKRWVAVFDSGVLGDEPLQYKSFLAGARLTRSNRA